MDIYSLVIFGLLAFLSGLTLVLALSGDKFGKIVFPIVVLCVLSKGVDIMNGGVKAIDVYRGKTELKITYQGNTPVDTVVVYKKN